MSSRSLIIGAIAIGVAVGYVGGFLTFYNTLSNVESRDPWTVHSEDLIGRVIHVLPTMGIFLIDLFDML